MKIPVSVSTKFQITLVEDIRKFFPKLKPGDKVLLDYDPIREKITVEVDHGWEYYIGRLKSKTQKKYSIEEEDRLYEEAMTKYYKEKYGTNWY